MHVLWIHRHTTQDMYETDFYEKNATHSQMCIYNLLATYAQITIHLLVFSVSESC